MQNVVKVHRPHDRYLQKAATCRDLRWPSAPQWGWRLPSKPADVSENEGALGSGSQELVDVVAEHIRQSSGRLKKTYLDILNTELLGSGQEKPRSIYVLICACYKHDRTYYVCTEIGNLTEYFVWKHGARKFPYQTGPGPGRGRPPTRSTWGIPCP